MMDDFKDRFEKWLLTASPSDRLTLEGVMMNGGRLVHLRDRESAIIGDSFDIGKASSLLEDFKFHYDTPPKRG